MLDLQPGNFWYGGLRSALQKVLSQIDQFLKQGAFSHVRAKTETIPVGGWAGRLGNLLAQDILAGWPSMRPLAHSLVAVSPEQFDAVIGQLATEWDAYPTSYDVYFSCGQA